MNILINVLLGIYILVALLMILVILMQRPKAEGLGAAFGGGMTENLFGAQTTNVLTKFTGWLAGFFFVLTFLLSILYAHKGVAQSSLRGALMKGQTAAAPAGTAPSASPGPSSAVGAPGTVTNLAPVTSSPAMQPTSNAADMAVGAAPVKIEPQASVSGPTTVATPAAAIGAASSSPPASANSPAPKP